MEDKKNDAAEVGTICDTKPNGTKNIIAQAIIQGKDAVYLKRDGWTMMPQLPTEEGEYLQIHKGKHNCYYMPVRWAECLQDTLWVDVPELFHIVAWRKLPEIPEWAKEEAE